ncbi:hypothetical protein CO676_06845 [Sinorhizobium sp. BJ1]|nr:hypothetical protein CO676_06845 [Sinorhizobium sp. BJ1]
MHKTTLNVAMPAKWRSKNSDRLTRDAGRTNFGEGENLWVAPTRSGHRPFARSFSADDAREP